MAGQESAASFARQIQKIVDPSKVDLHFVDTQTASKSSRKLLQWARNMRYHEAKTRLPKERVYLVVSTLKFKLKLHRYSGPGDHERSRPILKAEPFLDSADVDTLHERHWAVEINGRYYELVRDDKISTFSSEGLVNHDKRHIVARIFIGTSHCERQALDDIGKAVISTQGKYELTRDNCHRFARVFATLALCPNHPSNTIQGLPFNLEEHVAMSGLDSKGRQGVPLEKLIGVLPLVESDLHRASRVFGEGIEWELHSNEVGSELRRTIRRLKQKVTSDGETTTRHNQFHVSQEQNSYFIEPDPHMLYHSQRCLPLSQSPYLSIIRFDKITKYDIEPSYRTQKYKLKGSAKGYAIGPYGVTWSRGRYTVLRPTEIINDSSNVWRKGDGQRLEKHESTMVRAFNEVQDCIWRTSRRDFTYQVPTWTLLKTVGLDKIDPLVLVGSAIAAGAVVLQARRDSGSDDDSRSRSRSRVDNQYHTRFETTNRTQYPETSYLEYGQPPMSSGVYTPYTPQFNWQTA